MRLINVLREIVFEIKNMAVENDVEWRCLQQPSLFINWGYVWNYISSNQRIKATNSEFFRGGCGVALEEYTVSREVMQYWALMGPVAV
jgi:hypothetical protein